ncbi:asialoglycoprotein receptor 1-like [Rhineura floridana]|uniref:asialoglycoprotein receptor 1-like n=1 Tax=Rhineura floridana TaxID=261503 RepID=UPI002AC84C02|nr:asialoglycoprotein receptor 1-like [Rhineura floridana]XP_061446088.1 asialoglycoprotein receptor 1-like [Rhineura floridana]
MIQDYQDLATLDVEAEGEIYLRKVPPGPSSGLSWRQRVCPSRRLVLILLGLSSILTVAVIVFGAKSSNFRSQLSGMQDTLISINQTVVNEMEALLQRGVNTETKMTRLEGKVKQVIEEAKAGKERLLAQMHELQRNFRTMNCDLENFKHNRTANQETCCPKGWDSFRKSCYWESRIGKPWEEAKADCEDRDSHLVIINSLEEQQFVVVRVQPQFMWIGLTDASGSWKWVDGTPYTVRQEDWKPEQPDNWYGHGLGGGEDCAHLHNDGRWNDDHCSRHYGWICEMETRD